MEKSDRKVRMLTKLVGGQEVFSTFDVLKILNIKRGRLVQWMKASYIPEGTQVAWGEGSKTVFGINDLYCISCFKLLVNMGLNRRLSSEYADRIDWDDVKSRKMKYMVIIKDQDEDRLVLIKNEKSLKQLVDFESAMFLNLVKIIENIDRRV
jgi:hypothetical protein